MSLITNLRTTMKSYQEFEQKMLIVNGEFEFVNLLNKIFFLFSARLLSSQHLIQTVLHILQMGISYLLMLIAMTFNIYLFLAIILGAGLGHLLFGWRRSSIIDYNEHCHWKIKSNKIWNIFVVVVAVDVVKSSVLYFSSSCAKVWSKKRIRFLSVVFSSSSSLYTSHQRSLLFNYCNNKCVFRIYVN